MGMSLSKLLERVKDREAWCSAVHGITKSWISLTNWTTNAYLSIYLSIYTYIHIYKEIYCNSLSHVIIEAEKSHSLLYTSWRTRRAYGIIPVHVQRPGNQESWMCKFQAEFRRTSKSYYENTCIERAPFVLFRPLKTLDENPPATHLPPLPTHTQRKGKLLSESYLFRC